MVALVPARGGSQRIPKKNRKLLAGYPLLAYTLAAATTSQAFDDVMVSTDHPGTADLAKALGYAVHIRRATTTGHDPDYVWLRDCLDSVWSGVSRPDAVAILRPTSPFRSADDIRRGCALLTPAWHSVRAVRPVREHPGKMWAMREDERLLPVFERQRDDGTPWHSSPTQSLPPYVVQTSSFEAVWTHVIYDTRTISGTRIRGFFHADPGGFALDTPDDWAMAEHWAREHPDWLPLAPLAPAPVGAAVQ